ncbi:hypothetical protein J6590_032005 [Homalodisca vitripennis]|nr:hypothetical protein J6590_032005 [Homalodisca vitripennis]
MLLMEYIKGRDRPNLLRSPYTSLRTCNASYSNHFPKDPDLVSGMVSRALILVFGQLLSNKLNGSPFNWDPLVPVAV